MNAEGITLGEMGYGSPPNERLRGIPMPFLLRDVMTYSRSLADVRRIIKDAPGECSYVFLMSDGKKDEAEMYIKDPDRFIVFKPGQDAHDKNERLPGIDGISYGGRYNEKMTEILSKNRGQLSIDLLKDSIIPEIAMKSNFQNVIYLPRHLRFLVSNALSKDEWAASQPYTLFDLKKALETI